MWFWKQCVLFYLGGSVYMTLEFAWRGFSHFSMFLAGGCCFLLIGRLGKLPRPIPLPVRAVLGAGIITAVELLAGLIFNRSYTVWDYRKLPLNFQGQICLPFTLLWAPLSIAAGWLFHGAETQIDLRLRAPETRYAAARHRLFP